MNWLLAAAQLGDPSRTPIPFGRRVVMGLYAFLVVASILRFCWCWMKGRYGAKS